MPERTARVNIITEFTNKGVQAYAQQTTQASNATQQLDKGVRSSGKSVSALGGIVSKAGVLLAAAFSVTSIIKFGKTIIDVAKQTERTEKAIQVFTGSLASAKLLIQDINDLAIRTPFEDDQLISAGRDLLKYGVAAKDIVPILEDVSEVAVATGADLGGIAPILGRIQAQGKATFRELSGIISSGIPIYNLLSDSLGISVAQVKKLGQQGKISSEDISNAFKKATDEGGRFNGVLAAQANSIGGLQRAIRGLVQNGITQNLGRIFQPLIKEGLRVVLDLLGDPNNNKSVIGRLEAMANSDGPIRLAANFGGAISLIKAGFNALFEGVEIGINVVFRQFNRLRKDFGNFVLLTGQLTNNTDLIAFGASQVVAAQNEIAEANAKIAASQLDIAQAFEEADGKVAEIFYRLKKERDDLAKKPIIDGILGDDGELKAALGSLADLEEKLKKLDERISKATPRSNLIETLSRKAETLQGQIELLRTRIETLRQEVVRPLPTKGKDDIFKATAEILQKQQDAIISAQDDIVAASEETQQGIADRAARLGAQAERTFAAATLEAKGRLLNELSLLEATNLKDREKAFNRFEDAVLSAQVKAAQDQLRAAKASLDSGSILDAQNVLLDAQIAQVEAAAQRIRDALSFSDIIEQGVLPIIDSIRSITDALEEGAQRAFEIQERRVSDAAKLAEKGNAELLQLEEDRLTKSEERRRKSAQITRELAAIEFVANSIVAISKAAATEGPLALALIPVLLAVIAGGIAQAKALSQGFEKGTEYVDGQPGRDKIRARLTKGERVVDAGTNAKLDGIPNASLPDAVKMYYAFRDLPVVNDHSKQGQGRSFREMEKQIMGLRSDIANMRMHVGVNEWGIYATLEGVKKKAKRRDGLQYDA